MDELKAVYSIIVKCWKMFKEDAQNIGTDNEWMIGITDKYNRFSEEYIYGPMRGVALDMSKMCVFELERLFKEKNHIGGPNDRWEYFENGDSGGKV